MNHQDLKDASDLLLFVEGRYRAAFGNDPVHMGWREHIKHMYQSAFGSPCPYTTTADYWAEAWKSYKIPQPLVSGLQFPKWRDETMESQEKRRQEETDRYFAWLGAKHATQAIEAEFSKATVAFHVAESALEKAKKEMTDANAKLSRLRGDLEAGKRAVAALAPSMPKKQ